MRYVLGVDGGPGGTSAVLVDACGNLLGAGQSGAVTLDRDEAGAQRVRKALGEAILNAISMADLENAHISGACVSMAGDPEELECICAPVIPSDNISFGAQAHVALKSVSLGSPGVVVLADARVEAYGENGAANRASIGGWGRPCGDDGSAHWIAVRALTACCKASDGTGPQTLILSIMLQHLEADSLRHVLNRIGRAGVAPTDGLAIMDVVSMAAAQGDPTARRIMRDAGKELGTMVNALTPKLNLQDELLTVGTVGSVFRSGRQLLRTFREVVLRRTPRCRIIGPQAPSCVGAAIIALEAIGVDIQEDTAACILSSVQRLNGALKM